MQTKLNNSDLILLLPKGYKRVANGAELYEEMYRGRKFCDVQMFQNLAASSCGNIVISHIDPSDAMKLLLEVYGIPQNFLEENNPFMEYAKKNGINSNFAFENLFKDMQSYINKNKKNSKKNNNIIKNSKKIISQEKENIDADGDLIIESESENENDSLNEEKDKDKKKSSKHCVFDSKKNSQIVYLNEQKENQDEVGKIIDNINKKAEKGIKIGEKTIFSNYKGIREHNMNNAKAAGLGNVKALGYR